MTLFAVGSVHGSPGATTLTTALAAVWPEVSGRLGVVVEADPDGGVLAARHEELRTDRTLADLAVAARRSLDTAGLVGVSRSVWGSVPVVPAPTVPDQVAAALAAGGSRLATVLDGLEGCDVFVDVGRVRPSGPARDLLAAGRVLVLCRPRFEDVVVVGGRVRELATAGIAASVVCVGSSPYDPAEVADTVRAPLVGVVADDPKAAAVLSGGAGSDRRVRRSGLWRSVVDLAAYLVADVTPESAEGPAPTPAPVDVPVDADESGEVAV